MQPEPRDWVYAAEPPSDTLAGMANIERTVWVMLDVPALFLAIVHRGWKECRIEVQHDEKGLCLVVTTETGDNPAPFFAQRIN